MWKRYRGVLAIGVALAAIAAYVLTSDPADEDDSVTAETVEVADDIASMDLPPEVVPWEVAEAEGRTDEIEWGERCDTTTGTLRLPYIPELSCFAPFEGDNGGATAPGVTATTIRVVAYEVDRSGALVGSFVDILGSAASAESTEATQRGFVEMFSHYYETYGRAVELVRFQATGAPDDAVAAVADAETIARDLEPYIVLGGPALTNAFADTLANRGVICISCAPGQPNRFYEERAPYVWDILKNPEQNGIAANEYIGKRLAGRPAKFAGDPAMREKERVFGSVHIELGPDTVEIEEILEADLKEYGVELAANVGYTDPTQVSATGRDMITRLKEAGVTSVIFTGDPLAPGTLTRIATEQGYFPEWIITGEAFIDTTILSRTYDQQQWAHAFGPANLFARSTSGSSAAAELWRWYFGTEIPVPGAASAALYGPLLVLFLVLQFMGPDVNADAFQQTLFTVPTLPGSPTLGQISFGTRLWEDPDFTALDDQAEVWWDPTAEGPDELAIVGKGMWRWMDNGARVLPGDWPETEPTVFDPAGAVTMYEEPPLVPPDYPPVR
ncbi:MAG TPA: hypothetical protein VJM33_12155 [Microthrixaceae bacterium]|nr:hypothetical protein [Microthrixaceae bacterium]